MMARATRASLLLIAACSGSASPTVAPPAQPVVVAAPRMSADDVEVARVNGRPVWASCVTAQAAAIAGGPDDRRRAALDQCVGFELMAQAAEQRGLASAPEVGEAVRAAEVSRLVETDFEARYRSPADMAQAIEVVLQRNAWRMHILQLRASTFARFVVKDGAPPDAEAKARAAAEQLAGELAGQTGLYGVHLVDAAKRIATGRDVKLEFSDVQPKHHDDLVEPYAGALYAIPAVGEASPAIRTKWGWDVVVWTGGVEAKERTRDEVVADMFPELRRRQFQLWVTTIAKQRGVHVETYDDAIAALDQPSAQPSAPLRGAARPGEAGAFDQPSAQLRGAARPGEAGAFDQPAGAAGGSP